MSTTLPRRRLTAAAFVDELVDSMPSFRDVVLYDGRTLTLHRRAQNLAADLGAVYGKRDERFAFPDMDQLAADSGECAGGAWRLCAGCRGEGRRRVRGARGSVAGEVSLLSSMQADEPRLVAYLVWLVCHRSYMVWA